MRQEHTYVPNESMAARKGTYLSAAEISEIVALLKEVRETTQSRRTFRAASELISRLAKEDVEPILANDDDEAI